MSDNTPDIKELKSLLQWVNLSDDIQELGIRFGDIELNMSRTPGGLQRTAPAPAPAPAQAPAPAPAAAPAEAAAPAPAPAPAEKPAEAPAAETPSAGAPTAAGEVIKAPMVGTFYAAPQPGAPAFVKVGDEVEPGQVLCIVEVMKLMNNIEAKFAGTVREILVENEAAVEHGQPLMVIEPK